MKLLIDGSEKEFDFDAAKNIEEAFAGLKESLPKNRIIVEISVDGQLLSEENEKELLVKELDSIESLSIKTDSPSELAKLNLKEAEEYLDSFTEQIDDVIEVLQVGGEEDTYDIFVDGLKGVEEILYLVDVVKKMLQLESSDLVVNDEDIDEYIDNMSETLKEFKGALEDEDLVYMQDLLQYELKPALQTLKDYLAVIIGKLD